MPFRDLSCAFWGFDMKKGDRVNTKLGPGVVCGFEYIPHVKLPIVYPETLVSDCRVQVMLDNPQNWSLSAPGVFPYFVQSEISSLA
jgi:hypothetical protein